MIEKTFKGIIFDFNGTLFLDSPLHEKAWLLYVKEKLGRDLTKEEYYKNMHGRPNPLICEYLFGEMPSEEITEIYGREKEEYYRHLCEKEKEKNGKIELCPGAEELLDFLNEREIPHAIATSSERVNVKFFREIFGLDKWFKDRIVFDDGTVKGKPHPDIYLKTGELLNIDMSDLVIVEDSASGVQAARSAGAGLVVGIAPYGKENFVGKEYTDLIISDFNELSKEIFK